jgi:hypothetical protein
MGAPRSDGSRTTVDPASLPQYVVNAVLATERTLPLDVTSDEAVRVGIAAALVALGCEWDDDQGKNTMRRIVGAWTEKP